MNELTNIIHASGIYKNKTISLTSNINTVSLVDEIKLIKEANKIKWTHGYLTYKIIIENNTNKTYNNAILNENISNLVILVEDSIKVNENKAIYDYSNQSLSIHIDEIKPNAKTIVSFSIKKKKNDFFILKNYSILKYDNKDVKSNYITILSPLKKETNIIDCSTPYWRQ